MSIGFWKNKKRIEYGKIVCMVLIPGIFLLAGISIGHALPRNESVESALQTARKECERELYGNANFSQWNLNMCSSFLRRLAEMELAWRQVEVENSAGFSQMETDYIKWLDEWDKRLEEDRQRPSEFAGGSMEMMDCALRQYDLLCEQLDELECKWKNREK